MSCQFANIKVSPPKLKYRVVEGSTFIPPYHYVKLERDGQGISPRFELTASEDWVRYEPWSGVVPKRIRVGTSSIGMGVGTYTARLFVASSVEVNPPHVDIELEVEPKESEPDPEHPGYDPDPEPDPDPGPPDNDIDPPEPDPEPDPGPEPPDDNGGFDNPFSRLLQWIIEILKRIGILR